MDRTALATIAAAILAAAHAPAQDAEAAPAEEQRFLSGARQLTLTGRRAGEGYWSADGTRLVFQSEREAGNPFYQIYVLDMFLGDITRVSPGTGKTTCAFFRGSSDEVLFASTHHDPDIAAKTKREFEERESGHERRYAWDYDDTFDIFTAKTDGTALTQLTTARGYDAEGAWSPDGSLIVFSSNRQAFERSLSKEESRMLEMNPAFFADIYTMKADGTEQRRLTTADGYDGGPFFSPDGKRIVWRRFDRDGIIADVWTMAIDGTDQRQVTDFGSMSWAPYYHPSGEYIIFGSNKLGFTNFELYIVDAEGTKEPVRVTHTPGFDSLAVFSPDGTRLVWTSTRGDLASKGQLWIGNWNHDAARRALADAPPRQSHGKGTVIPTPAPLHGE
jgi:Tol biopolymer transport system component